MVQDKHVLVILFALAAMTAHGQLSTEAERAALGSRRRDFSCKAEHFSPRLAFDLRYHAGWRVRLKPGDFGKDGDRLRFLVRVTPVEPRGQAMVLSDTIRLPPSARILRREISLSGGYSLGPGRYETDVAILDSRGRACTASANVRLKVTDDLLVALSPGTVSNDNTREWFEAGDRAKAQEPSNYRIRILANFSNTNPRRSTLNGTDTRAVASILQTVAREPRFSEFDLAAFNMQERRVFFEQKDVSSIDFRSLGRRMSELNLGRVDISDYIDKNSATKFVTKLLTQYLAPEGGGPADAVILVGPKLFLDKNVPKEAIDALEGSGIPVFYLNYVYWSGAMPWTDTLGAAVRRYGGKEFRITMPKDLAAALAEIVKRLDEQRKISSAGSSTLAR